MLDVTPTHQSLLNVVSSSGTSATSSIIFTQSVGEALGTLELEPHNTQSGRLIAIAWQTPPRIDSAISDTISEIASVALSLWPNWPSVRPIENEITGTSRRLARPSIAGNTDQWLVRAWELCNDGRLPVPGAFGQAIHVQRLCGLFADEPLYVVLAVEQATLNDPGLDSLCRTIQWINEQTSLGVFLLLPETLKISPELTRINLPMINWRIAPCIPPKDPPPEHKNTYWPLAGQPHPQSPGEQQLGLALAAEGDLQGIFKFNVLVETEHNTRYYVDLLAAELSLVIEVDGYSHHASPLAFSIDRLRDYELHTSGYLVLRLPHDEVIKNMPVCISRIRRLVEFRSNTRTLK